MHIPDSFVSPVVSIATTVISVGTIKIALNKTKEALEEKQVPYLGAMAAFIFAAQMINFYIFGGTSGHLIGAVLASIIFGPWASMIIMTAVLTIQCIVFQDGGITALGANVLNMGILAPLIGYKVYQIMKKTKTAIFVAAWLSVLVSSIAVSLELSLSGIINLDIVLPAMLFWHIFIGIGEGLITVAALNYIFMVKPSLKTSEIGGG